MVESRSWKGGGRDVCAVGFRDAFLFCFILFCVVSVSGVILSSVAGVKTLLCSLVGGPRGRRNVTRVGQCLSAMSRGFSSLPARRLRRLACDSAHSPKWWRGCHVSLSVSNFTSYLVFFVSIVCFSSVHYPRRKSVIYRAPPSSVQGSRPMCAPHPSCTRRPSKVGT